jgi:hypothetical protein
MKSKLIHEGGERTFVLVFDEGDEVAAGLKDFARKNQLMAAHFTAIGAFRRVQLGYFEYEKKSYLKIPVNEQVEVLSLLGNIAEHKGEPKVHAHVVLGKRDGTAHGGHLLEAYVRPTLEVILVESPLHLHRRHDEKTGLALLDVTTSCLPPRRGREADAGCQVEAQHP